MKLDDRLTDVTVIGAAGKMGSGIATLVAQEMAQQKIKNPRQIFKLNLIDVNEEALEGLRSYIKKQLLKLAEKSIVALRSTYEDREDLVENWEIIDAFVNQGLDTLRFGTDLNMAKNSCLVFEAIVENEDLKIKILSQLKQICPQETLYFTNTSSIPIGFLDREVGLGGNIIGYHFYNPPIVQKLLEVITSEATGTHARETAMELGRRLGKKLVPANDIAGFIGNGHFIRDGLHALHEVNRLTEKESLPEAIYIINRISQDFLIRPMGIFQLIDYVGIDVFQCILKVMSIHLPDSSLTSSLINRMMENGIKGGQHSDGSQKDGFFCYEKGRPTAIHNLETGKYVGIAGMKDELDARIGDLPDSHLPWKNLTRNPDKSSLLAAYFKNLQHTSGLGAELARNYMIRSREIGEKLVADGVAGSTEDVNDVLVNGFYWLYGPINDYIK